MVPGSDTRQFSIWLVHRNTDQDGNNGSPTGTSRLPTCVPRLGYCFTRRHIHCQQLCYPTSQRRFEHYPPKFCGWWRPWGLMRGPQCHHLRNSYSFLGRPPCCAVVLGEGGRWGGGGMKADGRSCSTTGVPCHVFCPTGFLVEVRSEGVFGRDGGGGGKGGWDEPFMTQCRPLQHSPHDTGVEASALTGEADCRSE